MHTCTLLLQQYCLLVAEDDDKHMSGRYCLMKTAKAAKLKAPELMNGIWMRKYLATSTQVNKYIINGKNLPVYNQV